MARVKNIALIGFTLAMLCSAQSVQAAGLSLNYGGRLVDSSGAGVDGPVDLDINFYDAAEGGNKLGTSPYAFSGVALSQGVFEVALNLGSDINSLFPDSSSATWIEVTDKTHGKTYPRQKFSAVPYALKVPVDGTSLVYDSNGNLAVKAVPSANVTGLIDALAAKASTTQALAGDVTGNLAASVVGKIRGVNVSATTPTVGQVLSFAGGQWQPQTLSLSNGTVTSVGVTAPLAVTNASTTPSLSLAQANSAANGYLSSSDWLVFNAKQNALGYAPLSKAGDTMSGALNMGAQTLTNLAAPVNASDAATKTYVDTNTGLLLKKDGSTPLTGAWTVGNDVTSVGNVGMAAQKTLLLGTYAGSQETSLTATLASADRGRTWFNSATNQIKFWDGSAVQTLGVSGAGLTSLNGQSGGAQTFASGTSGTTPNWSSATNTHTLNIPLASAGGVTAGLLSNADYATFNGKIGSVAGGTGLSVTTSGSAATVNLANTAVTAGSYTRANITVDAQGRVTSAANGASVNLGSEVTGTLPVGNGGTGATTFTSNGVILGNTTGNLLSTGAGAADQVLRVPGAGGTPAFGAIDLTKSAAVTGALAIANGGSGATTPTAARSAFGAAASGANSDITSLTGLTTALSVAQGGTGTTAAPTSGQLPIGNGSSYTLATLSSGTGITITNGAGAITVAASADASTKVSKAGDTMTGVLNLPANGLVAGTNQFVLANGNVGIGTTSPTESLAVAGNIALGPTPGQYRYMSIGGGNSLGYIYGSFAGLGDGIHLGYNGYFNPAGNFVSKNAYASTRLTLGYDTISLATSNDYTGTVAPQTRMTIAPSGNVGIGTTAPNAPLDVRQDSPSSWMMVTRAASVDNSSGFWQDGSKNAQVALRNGSGSLNVVIQSTGSSFLNGGRVGIGSTLPVAQLDAESTATNTSAADAIYANTTLTANASGTYWGGGIETNLVPVISSGVTNSGELYSLIVRGTRNSSSDQGTLNHIFGQWMSYGHADTTARTTTAVYGLGIWPQHFGGTIGTDYGLLIGNAGGTVVPANYYGIYQQDGTAKNYFGGNVGIGTTAPSAPLHVSATSNTSPANNGLYVYNPTNSAGNNAILSARVAGSSAGSPFASFDVNGINGWSLGVDNADSQKFKIGNSWASPATNTYLTILSGTGNVGIGTTTPGAKLEVAGTAGTDGIKFPDGTLQTTAAGNISLYYTASAATSLSASAMSGAIAFGNKIWDTNNAFNGSTFTAPVAGIYQVSTCLNSTNGALAAFELDVYKNSARYNVLGGGANYSANVVCGTGLVKLAASDTMDIRAYTTTSGASTYGGNPNYATWLQIIRLSN